ncbi:MAG TPA: hypothetical protein VK974_00785 [Methylophilaceae bacterium]|nr:hypothetical protein [Methylophilaceae bacterium]
MSEGKVYTSGSQERGYHVLLLLAGNEFTGVLPGEIAKALNTSPSNITRDLRVLQNVGLAEPLPHDEKRWRLGPKLVQISNAFTNHLSEVNRRMGEIQQRYTRIPT